MIQPEADVLAALRPWLAQRRWFAGKGHRITGLAFASAYPLDVPGAWHTTVAVEIEGGTTQVYQVPLLLCDIGAGVVGTVGGRHLHDGLQHSAVVAAMLGREAESPHVDPSGASVPEAQWLRRPPPLTEYRLLGVEQSNTSAVFGDALLVKVFRLLRPGINPDIEVHEGLAAAGCADVGRLWGWVNGGWTDPGSGHRVHGHLAMIQEFFPGAIDGWELGLEYVAEGRDFGDHARALGETTARVHAGLATAFPTAALGDAQILAMSRRLHDRLSAAIDVVPDLRRLAPGLGARLDRLTDLGHLRVQRVHGDYHLAQALLTEHGWRVVDFEGEPGGDLDARRVLDHPLRDVAAMLRSFDYAAWQGAGNSLQARAWRDASAEAFLAGYGERTLAQELLLSVYTVDKAVYEAVYEQRNRPEWVEIPLAALAELA